MIVLFDKPGRVDEDKGMVADGSFAVQWPEVRGIATLGVNSVFRMQVQTYVLVPRDVENRHASIYRENTFELVVILDIPGSVIQSPSDGDAPTWNSLIVVFYFAARGEHVAEKNNHVWPEIVDVFPALAEACMIEPVV